MKFAKLFEDAIFPTRKNPDDVGIDLYIYNPTVVEPHSIVVVGTGITVEIPQGYFGWITNKSRNNFLIGGGIIDSIYQGELLIKIINPTDQKLTFKHGTPIAQLIILPEIILSIEEASLDNIHKTKTARGSTGGIVEQFVEKWD